MSTRVALVTCAELPELDDDGPALLASLAVLGVEGVPEVWDDPAADWGSYDLVVVRSTWDYAPRLDGFLGWADGVAAVTRLANPTPVLHWNTDKRYLRELAEAGLPVVETLWIGPADPTAAPELEEYVIKPAVSAGALDTARYRASESDRAIEHLARLQADGRLVMVQPYLAAVDEVGETGLMFVGGKYSHAIRKGALLPPGGGLPISLYAEEAITGRTPSAAELDLAERVLDAVPGGRDQLLYARVDLVPDVDTEPVLLELELTEPGLFLFTAPGSADRFAAAIATAAAD